MANKYEAQARASRKARARRRMCGDKAAYLNEEAARQKGQRTYLCPHCGLYHRSGQFAALLASVRRKKRR